VSSFEGPSITPASSEAGNDFDTVLEPGCHTRTTELFTYGPARLGCACITAGLLIMIVIRTFVTGRNTSCPFSDSSSQIETLLLAQNYRAITSAMVLETLPDPQYITFYRTMQSPRPFEHSVFSSWISSAVMPSIRGRHQFDASALRARRCATLVMPLHPLPLLSAHASLWDLEEVLRLTLRKVSVPGAYIVYASITVRVGWMTPHDMQNDARMDGTIALINLVEGRREEGQP
jgi:hypothetical protein